MNCQQQEPCKIHHGEYFFIVSIFWLFLVTKPSDTAVELLLDSIEESPTRYMNEFVYVT